MNATDNKFLTLKPGCILTPRIEPTIVWLDQFFEAANLKAVVTRGLTDAAGQLATIRQFLHIYGLDKVYPNAMTCKVTDTYFDEKIQKSIYVWQMAWSNLLNKKIIINPAFDAMCLMDYYGTDGKGPNKKGKVINETPHKHGGSFDIGGAGGEDKTIADELKVVNLAFSDPHRIPDWIFRLPERGNNCIHNDCK
jgi:hypothetical protein